MGGIRYLPLEYLHIEFAGAAIQVTGRVFTSESVAAALQIPQSRMHELAWLVGNDNSSDLIEKYHVARLLGIPTVKSTIKGRRCLPKDVALFLARLPEGNMYECVCEGECVKLRACVYK